jgi:hypothetical protein
MASSSRPLPKDFRNWQVALRHYTMVARNGAPHIGVAPTVMVKHPGVGLGIASHSVICGLLPNERLLENKTREFKALYEEHSGVGAKQLYDAGIEYLLDYYQSADDFDPATITSLLPEDCELVKALRAEPVCALVFNSFDPTESAEIGGPRCLQIEAEAEVLTAGPVYDNVWWHNTLFHGPADEHVVIHFKHTRSWDTRFGGLQALRA